ncbi:MAG: hypothetical protein EXR62_11280 [Chloroflexi bacterium]|nr:hypothetical protein [Chloroflexota bacterium]
MGGSSLPDLSSIERIRPVTMTTFLSEDVTRRGYLALPPGQSGSAILVLHAWWGLNPFFQGLCDRLAAEGSSPLRRTYITAKSLPLRQKRSKSWPSVTFPPYVPPRLPTWTFCGALLSLIYLVSGSKENRWP